MRVSNRLMGIVLFAAVAQVALLWWSDVPFGVPGEWTWPQTAIDVSPGSAALTAAFQIALYAALVSIGARRLRHAGSAGTVGWLAALIMAGCAWLWVAIETTPGPLGLGRGPFIIYYPGSSGYFLQARTALADGPQFLAQYEEELERGDVLHLGTHPPGLAMGYALVLDFCRQHPVLTDALLSTRPESIRLATDQLQRNESSLVPPFDRADAACLWLASILTLLCAVATVWPLYGLLAHMFDRETAWRLTALWPLVPALAVFYPKSDLLYPFLAMLFAWLWLTGWERGTVWRCALAAAVLLAGLLLSLAFLPVVAFVAVASLIQWWSGAGLRALPGGGPPVSNSRRAASLGAAVLVFVGGVVAFRLACDVNLLSVWRLNLVNHAGFYDEYPRTWWKWLLVNPVELAVAAGAVVTVLGLGGLARCPTNLRRHPVSLSVALVWAALWLSGKNMGEAARLWILLLPWLLVVAASVQRPTDVSDASPVAAAQGSRRWIALVVLQAALCLLTAHRVDGFHFEELIEQAAAVVNH